jgi:hypothetical protein
MGIRPKEIVLHMQVPSSPGLFVLGVFESRVTVYSQQVRALNLIYSLSKEEWIKGQTKIAVIGAGVAGLTAAAAAACCGADVVILERLSQPLAQIGQSNKRWLHPHIYEWPREDPDLPHPLDDDARLPLLNWQAGTVNKVKERLIEQYKQYEKKLPLDFRPHVGDITILQGNTKRFSLTWNEPVNQNYSSNARHTRTLQFDIVILALGFGLERRSEGLPFLSYWSSDKLDEEDASIPGHAKRYLVSGTGDGGLIDILRIRLQSFSHHKVVERLTRGLLDHVTLKWLSDRLRAIEADAERAVAEHNPYEAKLNEEYQKLCHELTRRVDISSWLGTRSDTQAVLTGLDDYPLSLQASILNRLLFSLLPDVKYLKGPWTSQRNDDDSIRITFANGTSEVFDEIIIRHGPDSALKKDFPDIWRQCTPLIARSILDQTRFPIYRDFFDNYSPPSFFGDRELIDEIGVSGDGVATAEAQQLESEKSPGQSFLGDTKAVGSTDLPQASSTREATTDEAPHGPFARITSSDPKPSNISQPLSTTSVLTSPDSKDIISPFILRGSVPADSKTYLRRRCDAQLQAALKREPLIAINGDFQIGKSSLLNQITNLPLSGWQICHFDVQGMRTDNLQIFISEFFGMLSDCIESSPSWERLAAHLKERPLILLFDEFGTLEDMGSDCAALIGKLTWLASRHPSRIRVVVCLPASLSKFLNQYNVNPKYSQPWHSITVKQFEKEEEIMGIFNLLPPKSAQVSKNNSRTIFKKSRGEPNRLQLLCDRLFREEIRGRDEEQLISIISDITSYES